MDSLIKPLHIAGSFSSDFDLVFPGNNYCTCLSYETGWHQSQRHQQAIHGRWGKWTDFCIKGQLPIDICQLRFLCKTNSSFLNIAFGGKAMV